MIDHSKRVIYGIKWTLPYGTSEKYNLYYQLSPYSNQKKEKELDFRSMQKSSKMPSFAI